MINRTPKKEVHKRIPVDGVDVTKYYPLVNKWVRSYERSYGQIITDNYEDFVSAGLIGILKAKEVYDPSRGTFVTIAFHKVFTEISNLYKKLLKQEELADNYSDSESDDSNSSSKTKRMYEVSGTYVDYGLIARLMTGRNLEFFKGLCLGYNRSRICAICDISYKDYDKVKQEVKEEVLEVFQLINGGV